MRRWRRHHTFIARTVSRMSAWPEIMMAGGPPPWILRRASSPSPLMRGNRASTTRHPSRPGRPGLKERVAARVDLDPPPLFLKHPAHRPALRHFVVSDENGRPPHFVFGLGLRPAHLHRRSPRFSETRLDQAGRLLAKQLPAPSARPRRDLGQRNHHGRPPGGGRISRVRDHQPRSLIGRRLESFHSQRRS
jgi:hypothetical protein